MPNHSAGRVHLDALINCINECIDTMATVATNQTRNREFKRRRTRNLKLLLLFFFGISISGAFQFLSIEFRSGIGE